MILGLSAVIAALIAGALARRRRRTRRLTASELFIYPLPLVATLAIVTGILMFTGEAQHGTLAVTLTARPARWVIVSAKTVTAVVVGVALGATGMVAGYAGAVARRGRAGRRIGGGVTERRGRCSTSRSPP